MSGIHSLLKYRFQRKETDKLPSASNSPANGVSSNSQDGMSPTPSSSQETNTIPETPPREMASSCSSPVIQKSTASALTAKRGAMVIGSDSEAESPVKSASSSPWLSKQTATSHHNGTANSHNSKGPMYYFAQTRSPAKLAGEEERELETNVSALQAMFPGEDRSFIVSALAISDNNIDRATDYLIEKGNKDDAKKRKRIHQRILSDSSDDQSQPALKKARPLEYSESQESTQSTSSASQQGMSEQDKVNFLESAFPNIPTNILEMTLKSKGYDLEKASTALEQSGLNYTKNTTKNLFEERINRKPVIEDDDDEPPTLEPIQPIVPQANMGSIKAFQALAKQQSMGGRVAEDPRTHRPSTSPGAAAMDVSPVRQMSREQRASQRSDTKRDVDSEAESSDSDQDDDTPSDPIVHFLNEATLEELTSMNGCSKKKAQLILNERPFDDWEDLVAKIEHSKELTFALISSCQEVIRMRGVVERLMKSCKRISCELENLVSELTESTTLDGFSNDTRYIREQPDLVTKDLKLKPYQMVGLNWLNIMHEQEINGILGDEMGLGKTVQTIAFLALLLEQGEKGPHVIVAPSSTLDNWLRELKRWCPHIKVIMYYGSQEDRRNVRCQIEDGTMDEFHVMVTTYNMASGSTEDRALFKRTQFHYAVFDEGHMLKNMSSLRYQALMKIKASRRLVLTGTPLQNNLVELMSLLAFVMPDMFLGKTDHIKKTFTAISSRSSADSKGAFERQTIVHAKEILKPFFLRRLKRDVLQQLPQKKDIIEKVAMAFEQQELYDSLKSRFSQELRTQAAKAGSSMLMELRKASNHHLLHRRIFSEQIIRQMAKIIIKEPDHPNAVEQYVYEDMEVMNDFDLHKLCLQYPRLKKFALDEEQILDTGKFRYLDEHLPEMKERGDRVLVFSQFTMVLDIVEQYMNARGHQYLRLDGQTPVAERQDLIDQYNQDEEIFIFLLSTKAGGLGINLTAANVVILHDIDFNPYNDKQAEDRCHRVGQTRDVSVYRLVSRNTVEEAMLRCAQAKLQLEQDVTGQGADNGSEKADVMSLLKDALAIDADT